MFTPSQNEEPSSPADRFRQLRARLRISQDQLAAMLGITRPYVSQVENGREPGPNILARLAVLERTGPYTADLPIPAARLAEDGPEESPGSAVLTAPDDSMSPEIQPGDRVHLAATEPVRGSIAAVRLVDGTLLLRRWFPVDRSRVSLRADNPAAETRQIAPGEYVWARAVWQITRKY